MLKSCTLVIGAMILLPLAPAPAGPPPGAQVWDARTQWSDAANPNGPWSYLANGVPAPAVMRLSDPWASPQVSWGDIPGWFRSNGTEQFVHDWIAGDIVTHTGVSRLVWTSPINGRITITGGVWSGRDIGRFNNWTLWYRGFPFSTGTIGSFLPDSRDTPAEFIAPNLTVVVGEPIILEIIRVTPLGDYVGVNMTVTQADAVAIVTQPQPVVTTCLLRDASFQITAGGATPITYQWQVEDPAAPGGWADLADGQYMRDGIDYGRVSGVTTPTARWDGEYADGASPGRWSTSLGRLRCAVTNAFNTLNSNPISFAVSGCAGDAAPDLTVGLADLATVINCWTLAASCDVCADLDNSGSIGLGDLAMIIQNWGSSCP